jgi:hypothetical protein
MDAGFFVVVKPVRALAAAVPCPASADNMAAAVAAAKACGSHVESLANRAEDTQTFANPKPLNSSPR